MTSLPSKNLASSYNWPALRLALFPNSIQKTANKSGDTSPQLLIEKPAENKSRRREKRTIGPTVSPLKVREPKRVSFDQHDSEKVPNAANAASTGRVRGVLRGGAILSVSALTGLAYRHSGEVLQKDVFNKRHTSMKSTVEAVAAPSQLNVTKEPRKYIEVALIGTTLLGVCVGTTLWILKNQ